MKDFPGRRPLNAFMLFNALSFWIILGSPIVLLTTWLGGGSRAVGLVSAIMPFLTIVQIPSTRIIERWGYRRVMFTGWTIRTVVISGIVLIPFFRPWLSGQSLMVFLALILFCWSFFRGMANAAWMPWMRSLVPRDLLGRFYARIHVNVQVMGLLILLLSGAILGKNPDGGRFSMIFLISLVAGAISLRFLSRVPSADIPAHEKSGDSLFHSVKASLKVKNYRRYLLFAIFWGLSNAGFESFCVLFLKKEALLSARTILWIGACCPISMVGILLFAGRFLDRWGSKPVMKLCLAGSFLYQAGWFLLAQRVLAPHSGILMFLYVSYGILRAILWIGNWRLGIVSVPKKSSLVALAVYTTSMGFLGGLAPLVWGQLLAILPRSGLTPYAVFFLWGVVMNLAALFALGRVAEEKAHSTSRVAFTLFLLPFRYVFQWMSLAPRSTHAGSSQFSDSERDREDS